MFSVTPYRPWVDFQAALAPMKPEGLKVTTWTGGAGSGCAGGPGIVGHHAGARRGAGRGKAGRCRPGGPASSCLPLGTTHVGDHRLVVPAGVQPPLESHQLRLPARSACRRRRRLDLLRALHVLVERGRADQRVVRVPDPVLGLVLQPENSEECGRDAADDDREDDDRDHQLDEREARLVVALDPAPSGAPCDGDRMGEHAATPHCSTPSGVRERRCSSVISKGPRSGRRSKFAAAGVNEGVT